jgi:glutamate N-acetyltransferase / amino-acid N-acetyltransferase
MIFSVPFRPSREDIPMGQDAKPSPFAPAKLPVMPVIKGVRFATREAGIKYKGRTDLLLAVFDAGTTVAGVLTRSKTRSAAVDWCRQNLPGGKARALVVNSGNANAFTGSKGRASVQTTGEQAAKAASCAVGEVFQSSTGVIGEPLDAGIFAHLLADMAKTATADRWHDAAMAIRTTDTYAKCATRSLQIGGKTVTINGIAKGAGMIAPNMATMLVYIATDAAVAAPVLQGMVSASAAKTFNCITVDSDTSTSDTVLVFATGTAGAPAIAKASDAAAKEFGAALHGLMHDLAMLVIKDGEGITKLVEIAVKGAENDASAHKIAMAVANSPLVKTAIAGEDANWGRIVMAVGKAGEAADRDKLGISMGGIAVARNGERVAGFDEEPVAKHMKGDHIKIGVDIGLGSGTATVWTCDLTHEYIAINADYRS